MPWGSRRRRGRHGWLRAGVVVLCLALIVGGGRAALGQARGQVAVVTAPDGLNLRAGPGSEFPSLVVLARGAELLVLGEGVNGHWLPVSAAEKFGYVHADYVAPRAAGGAATSTPARTPTSTPTAPSPPAAATTVNGVTLLGVFAADADAMITPADEFSLIASVRLPAGVARLSLRVSGATLVTTTQTFAPQTGDNWLQISKVRVAAETEPVLREAVIRTVGGTVPLRNAALVLAVDYQTAAGVWQTATFEPTVYHFREPARAAAIEFPNLTRLTGMPPGGGVDGFYLRGDLDFHHPADPAVRALAIEAGRRGGAFPDDPELVADNIHSYIKHLLGDRDPGDFNNDVNFARLIAEGTIRRGQTNGGYICIGQTYLMTSLTRTLGIPSRELNLAVGKPAWQGNDGVWRVTWFQEAAAHVWLDGGWVLYDLWLGFKGVRGYFDANIAYQMWAAFDRRSVPFLRTDGVSTGLRGHDFHAFPGEPAQWTFVGEAVKPGLRVQGMPDERGVPVTLAPEHRLSSSAPPRE